MSKFYDFNIDFLIEDVLKIPQVSLFHHSSMLENIVSMGYSEQACFGSLEEKSFLSVLEAVPTIISV